MENYGIRGVAFKIFESYFNHRQHRVSGGINTYSNWEASHIDCPQESILDPLLFLIFVSDIPKLLKLIKILIDSVCRRYLSGCQG